jgi:hypothetical protein
MRGQQLRKAKHTMGPNIETPRQAEVVHTATPSKERLIRYRLVRECRDSPLTKVSVGRQLVGNVEGTSPCISHLGVGR